MSGKRPHRTTILLASALLAPSLAGCGFGGLSEVPLPGGAELGPDPYRVTVEFADVLDLVPQAAVKVNDVPVGTVRGITTSADGWHAEVALAIRGDVRLPAHAQARLRQSSLLGEKFVELDGASGPVTEPLRDGAFIPAAATDRSPEVEEVFGALSMLLNGGGLGQVRTISRELNAALSGNEAELRALLGRLEHFSGELDRHRGDITRAIDGLDRLATTARERDAEIAGVLDDLGPGIGVLAEQREELVDVARSVDELSAVAVDTVHRGQEDLVADLTALRPVLRRFADAGADLPQAMEILLTYPFTDSVLDGVRGDYLNTYLTVDLDPAVIEMLNEQARQAEPDFPAPPSPGAQAGPR